METRCRDHSTKVVVMMPFSDGKIETSSGSACSPRGMSEEGDFSLSTISIGGNCAVTLYEVSSVSSCSLVRKIVVAAALAIAPAASYAGIFISVGFAPPALPVYVQPVCPTPGYLWNPGYWAYSDAGYYWVPGVWVQPPTYGLLWTPGYWGWGGGAYLFHAGDWG